MLSEWEKHDIRVPILFQFYFKKLDAYIYNWSTPLRGLGHIIYIPGTDQGTM